MFGKTSLKENPLLGDQLIRPMRLLSNQQIRQTDQAVLIHADDTSYLIETLKVNALALKGEEDFVPTPPKMETIIVKGGHVSPLESPLEVAQLISRLINLKKQIQ